MKPNNIFCNARGEPINQFQGDANGFSEAVKQIKHHGIDITKDTPQSEILIIVAQLQQGKNGKLCFLDE